MCTVIVAICVTILFPFQKQESDLESPPPSEPPAAKPPSAVPPSGLFEDSDDDLFGGKPSPTKQKKKESKEKPKPQSSG